jgi:transposase
MQTKCVGLAAIVEAEFKADPFSGVIYVVRSKRADRVELRPCLLIKSLEDGKFRWSKIKGGVMRPTSAQLPALLEGLDACRYEETRSNRAEAGHRHGYRVVFLAMALLSPLMRRPGSVAKVQQNRVLRRPWYAGDDRSHQPFGEGADHDQGSG